MIQQTQRGGNVLLTATEGLIHKIGTDTYVRSIMMLPGESADLYEEVAEKPAYSDHDYDVMVADLIHARYSKDKETALINNMLEDEPTDEHRREYAEYQAFRAECKVRAKEILKGMSLDSKHLLS